MGSGGVCGSQPADDRQVLSALWLWYEDPTASSLITPNLRWSKEGWLAATHPLDESGGHGLFLKVLSLPADPLV